MFKSAKRKATQKRAKVDFKFEFHVTRVPQEGWDKLMVLLISLESGKIMAKTAKSSVQNGSCEWAEPMLGSAKILQAANGKEAESGKFKLLVSTGSSRTDILGETMINLAEHACTSLPTSLSLPLQNGNSCSILHVIIHCLNPKVNSRTVGEDVSLGPTDADEEIEPISGVEESCDLSIHRDSISVRDDSAVSLLQSSSESIGDVPPPGREELSSNARPSSLLPETDYVDRQESSDVTTSFNGFNSSGMNQTLNDTNDLAQQLTVIDNASLFLPEIDLEEIPKFKDTMIDVNGTDKSGLGQPFHDSDTYTSSKPPTSGLTNPSMAILASEFSDENHVDNASGIHTWSSQVNSTLSILPRGSDRSPAKSHRRSSSLVPNSDVAETTLADLRKDAAFWEQHARKASSEVDRLKQQLTAETTHVAKMANELASFRAELETIKIEAEHLKSLKQSPVHRGNEQDKANVEIEDARNAIKELKEELAYEKSANLSLNLQLQKTNESNSELLLEIQDLEESLQRRHKELEEFKAQSFFMKEKEQNDHDEAMKITWEQKLEDSEKQKQQLQERIVLLEEIERGESAEDKRELERKIELLTKDLDELERDSQELTEENMNLFIRLKEADNKINTKETVIAELESKLAIISEHCFSTKAISDQIFSFINLPEMQAEKLGAVAISLTEKLSLLEEISCCQSASSRTPLENLDSSAMLLCSRNAELEAQLKCAEEKLASLMKEIDALKQETSEHEKAKALLTSQKGQLKCLREKVAQTTEDYENALRKAESLELAQTVLREETNQVIATLQRQLTSSEEKLAETGEECIDLRMKVAELLAENAKFSGQLSSLLIVKENAELSANAMEKLNRDFHERLEHAENISSRTLHQLCERETEISNLMRDLATTGEELKKKVNELAEVEISRDESEKRLKDIQEENIVGNLHIKDLECQSLSLKDDNESLKKSVSALESKSLELQLQNTELAEKLQAAIAKSDDATRKAESLASEIKALRSEIESNPTKCLLENQVVDLERSNQIMQEQVKTLMQASVQQVENINNLEERCTIFQDEKNAATNHLEEVQNEKNELEAVLQATIQQQTEAIQQVQFELNEARTEANNQKKVVWELETCVEKLENEIASRTVSCNDLERQLQMARVDCAAADLGLARANEKVERCHMESIEKESQLCRDMDALRDQTEEMLKTNQREKSILLETLQQVQKALYFDDEKNLATQELSETSQLMTENVESQEKLLNIQISITNTNAEALASWDDIDPIVQDAKKQGFTMVEKLKETLQELYELKQVNFRSDKKLAQFEDKFAVVENEKDNCSNLQAELETAKTALHEMKLQKLLAETSLQKVSFDNARLTEELGNKKETKKKNGAMGGLKSSKVALEDKVPQIQEHNAKGVKRAVESELRLQRQIAELKRKFLEQEEEKEGLKKKLCTLEEELKGKTSLLVVTEKKLKEKDREIKLPINGNRARPTVKTLSRSSSKVGLPFNSPCPNDGKEMADLRQKLKLLEEKLKIKSVELEATKYVLREKEAELCNKIERMNLEKENCKADCTDSHFETLQKELNSLQDENAALYQREHDLLSRVGSQEVLQNEIEQLKVEKQQLQNELSKFHEGINGGNIHKRVETLEIELAEALEASSIYKSQLQSFGSMEQSVNDVSDQERNLELERELIEMRDKYSQMSLQFAELEAERETLVMAVRNMRDAREVNKNKTF